MLFVSFVLGGTDYAVEVEEVYGIYHSLPIIPTPDSPPTGWEWVEAYRRFMRGR